MADHAGIGGERDGAVQVTQEQDWSEAPTDFQQIVGWRYPRVIHRGGGSPLVDWGSPGYRAGITF